MVRPGEDGACLVHQTLTDEVIADPEPMGSSPSDMTDFIWGYVESIGGRGKRLIFRTGSRLGVKRICQT